MENIDYFELEKTARPGAFSRYDMEVLIPELLNLEKDDVYLEVGVDKGRSLDIARRVTKEGVWIYGVDLRPDPEVKGTTFYQGDSVAVANKIKLNVEHAFINVLFIDGDHSYEGCKRDIDAWFPYLKKGGVMLFHDCDETSPGVMQAVAEFVCNYKGEMKEFKLCKNGEKNTSIARIRT